jgi:hypothetical protein
MRFIKVRAHRGDPLNEAADAVALAAATVELGTALPVELDLDPIKSTQAHVQSKVDAETFI